MNATLSTSEHQARIKAQLIEQIEEIGRLALAAESVKDKTLYGEAHSILVDKLDDAKKEAQNLIDDLG